MMVHNIPSDSIISFVEEWRQTVSSVLFTLDYNDIGSDEIERLRSVEHQMSTLIKEIS